MQRIRRTNVTPRSGRLSDHTTELAQRLWHHRVGTDVPVRQFVAEAERLCADLRGWLVIWIGHDGYRALLHRAIVLASPEHPVLAKLAGLAEEPGSIAAAVKTDGVGTVTEGIVALMSRLIELLERMVGTEMTRGLLEQAVVPDPEGMADRIPMRGTNG